MNFFEQGRAFMRGLEVVLLAQAFHDLMVIREFVESDTHGRVEVSVNYASGLSAGRRPRLLPSRTVTGRYSYQADDLLAVTIVSKPNEEAISPWEDRMTYLMATDGRVFLMNTQGEESSEAPDEAARERIFF